ncbi:MAG TPA: hypothetical protein VGF94_13800 [Kofleriaceae bacterium]
MARFHVGAVAIVVASCSWVAGLDDPLPSPIDGSPMIGTDGPTGPFCYGSGLVTVCFARPPSGEVDLPMTDNGMLDTTNCPNPGVISTMPSGAPGICVIAGSEIAIGAVTATGSADLVLVATGTITLTGVLDASTRIHAPPDKMGPGADGLACNKGGSLGSDGGGAGGSYGGRGGAGGIGGAASGSAIGVSPFHAGCEGEVGAGDAADNGGHGGGAVYLIARAISIAPNAAIIADGAGGGSGGSTIQCSSCGGGGGGTGGTIGLEAQTVTLAAGASLCAVGGGGGQGAGTDAGADGMDGMLCLGGPGGMTSGSGTGGSGGAGATTGSAGNGTGSGSEGGGGGGGSFGAIRIFAATRAIDMGATIVPPAP